MDEQIINLFKKASSIISEGADLVETLKTKLDEVSAEKEAAAAPDNVEEIQKQATEAATAMVKSGLAKPSDEEAWSKSLVNPLVALDTLKKATTYASPSPMGNSEKQAEEAIKGPELPESDKALFIGLGLPIDTVSASRSLL